MTVTKARRHLRADIQARYAIKTAVVKSRAENKELAALSQIAETSMQYFRAATNLEARSPKVYESSEINALAWFSPAEPDRIYANTNDPVKLQKHLNTLIPHEVVHYIRNLKVGIPNHRPDVDESLEEACAIFGEAAWHTKNTINRNDRVDEIATYISDRISKEKDAFELLKLAKQKFEERIMFQEEVLGREINPSYNKELLHYLKSAIGDCLAEVRKENAKLFGKESKLERVRIGRTPPYSVGTGLAIYLFTLNNLDINATLKEILTKSYDEMLNRISQEMFITYIRNSKGPDHSKKELRPPKKAI